MTITGLLLNGVYVYAIWNETNSYTIWPCAKTKSLSKTVVHQRLSCLKWAVTILEPHLHTALVFCTFKFPWAIALGGMKLQSNPRESGRQWMGFMHHSRAIVTFLYYMRYHNSAILILFRVSWSTIVDLHVHSCDCYCRYPCLVPRSGQFFVDGQA